MPGRPHSRGAPALRFELLSAAGSKAGQAPGLSLEWGRRSQKGVTADTPGRSRSPRKRPTRSIWLRTDSIPTLRLACAQPGEVHSFEGATRLSEVKRAAALPRSRLAAVRFPAGARRSYADTTGALFQVSGWRSHKRVRSSRTPPVAPVGSGLLGPCPLRRRRAALAPRLSCCGRGTRRYGLDRMEPLRLHPV